MWSSHPTPISILYLHVPCNLSSWRSLGATVCTTQWKKINLLYFLYFSWLYKAIRFCDAVWFTIVQCAPSPLCQQTGALCGTWGEFITLGTLYNDMGIDWMEINDWLAGIRGAAAAGRGQISVLTLLWSWFWSLLGPGDLGLGGHQIDFWLQSLCWLTRIFSHFGGNSAVMMVLSSNILQIHVSPSPIK